MSGKAIPGKNSWLARSASRRAICSASCPHRTIFAPLRAKEIASEVP
ncbi:Uncharacterised protein [Vibrio cholerae]|nr:Uncharacterised protein [Vibrio cholerae]